MVRKGSSQLRPTFPLKQRGMKGAIRVRPAGQQLKSAKSACMQHRAVGQIWQLYNSVWRQWNRYDSHTILCVTSVRRIWQSCYCVWRQLDRYGSHIIPILHSRHWLTVAARIQYKYPPSVTVLCQIPVLNICQGSCGFIHHRDNSVRPLITAFFVFTPSKKKKKLRSKMLFICWSCDLEQTFIWHQDFTVENLIQASPQNPTV